MSTNRLVRLHLGLVLFGVSVALMVRANLGLASWDVLHQGLAETTGLPMGWVIVATGVAVLLLWIPLRQRPGYGTIANVIVVGLVAQGVLAIVPAPAHLLARSALLGGAIVLNGIATALYVGAGLGPGPRDGLMTGLAARGHSIRVVRTGIELSVLAAGWLLGGTVGVGTVLYAVAIGPLVHLLLPLLSVKSAKEKRPMPRLNVVIASTRPGRMGGQVAEWFLPVANEHGGFDIAVTDLAALGLPLLDEPSPAVEGLPYEHEHTRQWSRIVSESDAFVFVMPEYNQGYAAPLKNALDYLYGEWVYKPVGFVCYGMSSGGLRAAAALRPVVTALKMVPVAETVVMHLRQTLDAEGKLAPTPGMADAAKAMLDELAQMTKALAAMRA